MTFKELKIGDKFIADVPFYHEVIMHKQVYQIPCFCTLMKIAEDIDDGVEINGEKFNIVGVTGDCSGWFGQMKYPEDEVRLVYLEEKD